MLQLIDVTLHRGDVVLFDHLNLTVYSGHKTGLVGRNGVGKTTLFELVSRRRAPEEGEVVWPDSWRLAWLDQNVEPSPRAALDFVLDGDTRLRRIEAAIAAATRDGDDDALGVLYSDYEDAGGYDAHARGGEILGGLGFGAGDFDKPHRAFSGGGRIRLNLARALMTPSDLLLLDEPTNHLDLDATLWLESWAQKYPGTLLTIAHDRDFLDQSMQEIVHLEDGRASVYAGNYSAFERQRAEALVRRAAIHKKQQQRVAEIRQFVDRFRAKESKAKQAQSRLKALAKMDLVAPVHAESPYRFEFSQPRKISNPTLLLDDAALGYDGVAVLEQVTLRVYPNDRIGVLGANGAGKTTLLRCLAGELQPLAGESGRGRHSGVGYFAQHQLESLNLDLSPLEQLEELAGPDGLTRQQALNYLGGWGFGASHVRRPARTLSGGERARLVLAIIARGQPAVLVLDEPTNHLDLDMREALTIALGQYQGALLLVAHDRHLLRRCVDDFWLVADGRVQGFKGDLDAYTALRQGHARGRRDRRRPHKKPARRSAARPLLQRQRRLEAEITAHARHQHEAQRRLAETTHGAPPEELAKLAAEAEAARAAVERCEAAWLAVQEELDSLDNAASGK